MRGNAEDCSRIYGPKKAEEDSEPTENERLVSFLTKSIEEKEETIKEKESDLECPICLEIAGGQIFCCVEQHLVCSQCRPRVVECPQCRQPYPPYPMRHRYAEKIVEELEGLREELNGIVEKLNEVTHLPSAPSLDQDQ